MSFLRVVSKSFKPMTGMRLTMRSMSTEAPKQDADVVIPELSSTLEWVLHSPPPLHQFEEAPIVVETFGPADPFH